MSMLNLDLNIPGIFDRKYKCSDKMMQPKRDTELTIRQKQQQKDSDLLWANKTFVNGARLYKHYLHNIL